MKDNPNFAELEEFLQANPIPTIKSHQGFLEIIRKSHNETINSNLYAYFLTCNEQGVKGVFLEALLSLISEKSKKEEKLLFNNFVVNTEVTSTLGRIDIVIQDLINQNTLIIENKIFHNINNPLLDYWNHYKIADDKKVGILLTLHPQQIPNEVADKFINITHWEWIRTIDEHLDYESIENSSLKLYLTDFINTVKNMSTTYQLNESAKFFFENAKKVNQAYETIIEGHRFMIEQYRLIASKLNLTEYGNDISYRSFWDEHNKIDTYFTITTHHIIQGEGFKYKIIIELFRDDRERLNELRNKFSKHFQYDENIKGSIFSHFTHFMVKEYETTLEDLNSFGNQVIKNIQQDFASLYVEMVEYLYPNTDISGWKENLI